MAETSDKELVKQCLSGDNRAFSILVEKYQATMYRTAFSIVKDPDIAKDVTQNGFMKSWEKLRSFNPDYKFYSWLYRIMVNEALNNVRNTKHFDDISSSESDNTPYHRMIKKEENRELHAAIDALSEDFRAVIYLRHFEELSYRDMAEVLNIDEKNVKSRLYGARMKLRETLFVNK